MHQMTRAVAAVAAVVLIAAPAFGQDDASRAIAGGGVSVPGWTGKIDAREAGTGMTLNDARFMAMGGGFHVTTGPAVTYWNPANAATGDYTIKATFNEPKFQSINTHPHPYGIVVAGAGLGTADESYLYCATYGNGRFIVRGFGPAAFQMNGRGEAHQAINRAAGVGQPVTQEIAVSVRGGKVECAVNGTVVGSYDRAAVVADGKLKSTDGIYGLRFGHNTEVMVTGLSLTKH